MSTTDQEASTFIAFSWKALMANSEIVYLTSRLVNGHLNWKIVLITTLVEDILNQPLVYELSIRVGARVFLPFYAERKWLQSFISLPEVGAQVEVNPAAKTVEAQNLIEVGPASAID